MIDRSASLLGLASLERKTIYVVETEAAKSCGIVSMERQKVSGYWVVGGRYASTRFDRFAEGASEERYGPFETRQAAEAAWQTHAWKTVDDCLYRFRIVEDEAVS